MTKEDDYKLISISGSSGVGKTTIANLAGIVLSKRGVLHLCGDDMHKWERGDPNWNKLTHLNPDANDLSLGKSHLFDLCKNKSIKRRIYDHNAGKFTEEKLINPASVIINEGLHSLYDPEVCSLSDVNIFINTDVDLKNQWKINRDISKRGYTKKEVLDSIEKRIDDENSFITPQIENADVVMNFKEVRDRSVHLDYDMKTSHGEDLAKRIKALYDLHRKFFLMCQKSSFEHDLIQGRGGNLSYKFEDKIIITSSGIKMSKISMLSGFSVCDLSGQMIDKKQDKPSMELQMHLKVDDKVVFHTHPIYLNVILCSENAKNIISSILDDYEYDYISYKAPGSELFSEFIRSPESNIILLENHGLVCCGESFEEVFNLSLNINQLCKTWLIRNSKIFKMFGSSQKPSNEDGYLFPDAVTYLLL